MKVIPIPPRGYLDTRLLKDIRFYAKFLAIYSVRLKRAMVSKDKDYSEKSLTE
jgi:hypothetical protein